ncbi:SDR family oxidoreductase [Celerinatantimonas diazotrophica]|uniref:Putative NAD(P)-binding protein n=1 Tax=Celerinatantimonas diazotrophica TaxID=412034 RepID=A0A4R1J7X3_9GAMM|nr:SDR family oxidoreductase [Celerinatantimonas diazotrophica]TCK46470.1 putative NAD(P)-binding protein [Celerinatantimonas diazotrophica]CAG9296520.1 putative sugar epimerase YhfK [Celerinatantimonas diazotrophica]
MRPLVVGANGQIGRQLINQLPLFGHQCTAMVRSSEQFQQLEEQGVAAICASLDDTTEHLTEVIKGHDSVIFTAGSGAKTGAEQTLLIDLDGAVKVMQAAVVAGVEHFVMVSAIGANQRERWSEALKPYYVAKHYADRELIRSGLNYTIIRPGRLINGPATGQVMIASEICHEGTIARADVASVICTVLGDKHFYAHDFDLLAGKDDIQQALEGLLS